MNHQVECRFGFNWESLSVTMWRTEFTEWSLVNSLFGNSTRCQVYRHHNYYCCDGQSIVIVRGRRGGQSSLRQDTGQEPGDDLVERVDLVIVWLSDQSYLNQMRYANRSKKFNFFTQKYTDKHSLLDSNFQFFFLLLFLISTENNKILAGVKVWAILNSNFTSLSARQGTLLRPLIPAELLMVAYFLCKYFCPVFFWFRLVLIQRNLLLCWFLWL